MVKPTTTTENTTAPVKPDVNTVLRTLLVTPSDKWIESSTSIPNVGVTRAPPTDKKGASLAVQVKLPSSFRNKLTVSSLNELEAYKKAINDPRLPLLINAVHTANGTVENPLEGTVILL
jgi:hypothetical protein